MKKIALYILAAAAVFAGCSKNNINTSPVDPEDAWMYDATLPVPIRLGANSTTLTKGAQINSLAAMDGKTFGFYAVNSGNDYAVTGNNWSTSVPSMPLEPGVQGVYNAETNRFDFVGGPYFYDQTDWTPYTFYGYYDFHHLFFHFASLSRTPCYYFGKILQRNRNKSAFIITRRNIYVTSH